VTNKVGTTAFESILVANRGEIALRVIRSAKALGYRTIAVYSQADAAAPHVAAADQALLLGPAPAADSYLDVAKILAAAATSGAQAIHPGYGFLSENSRFARACTDAGLVFIGPPASAIELMGNKAEAKRLMLASGVPCVPGYQGDDQSQKALVKEAKRVGFPLMVKAAAGGGGRGMRLVDNSADLPRALQLARSEAANAFGCDQLIIEKAIVRPRHVEIQVLADAHGNVIHLGERDCSVQRRHQKVVEEAPCPIMTAKLRQAMGAAALEAARSIDYQGAGTVEFLVDESGEFYFLEMNTRLQVEHPVTELVTGLDLVALQIEIAQGQELGLSQSEVSINGHAIEVRLYAEDPEQDFLPSTGVIDLWHPPCVQHVRVDAGVETGLEVSPFYDAMVAKIVAWGDTREVARRRLIEALEQTALFGPRSNRDFLIAVLRNPTFASGQATTGLIAEELSGPDILSASVNFEQLAAAAVLQHHHDYTSAVAHAVSVPEQLKNWSSSGLLTTSYSYALADDRVDLTVSACSQDRYLVTRDRCEGQRSEPLSVELIDCRAGTAELVIGEHRTRVLTSVSDSGRIHLASNGHSLCLDNLLANIAVASESVGGGRVRAPMHGVLIEVDVVKGDEVAKGSRVAVLEAMKMQHEILAEVDGVVTGVLVKTGDQVAADDLIAEIEDAAGD